MTNVYKQTALGWVRVFTAQSFEHACRIARQLESETGVQHCVNT